MDEVDLQGVADIVSDHSAHITAQRFLIQSLWVVLTKTGSLTLPGIEDPLSLLADRAFGDAGISPNSQVLHIFQEMIGEAKRSGEIIQFPEPN